jgi:LSD1 subclass zinc finger protein
VSSSALIGVSSPTRAHDPLDYLVGSLSIYAVRCSLCCTQNHHQLLYYLSRHCHRQWGRGRKGGKNSVNWCVVVGSNCHAVGLGSSWHSLVCGCTWRGSPVGSVADQHHCGVRFVTTTGEYPFLAVDGISNLCVAFVLRGCWHHGAMGVPLRHGALRSRATADLGAGGATAVPEVEDARGPSDLDQMVVKGCRVSHSFLDLGR